MCDEVEGWHDEAAQLEYELKRLVGLFGFTKVGQAFGKMIAEMWNLEEERPDPFDEPMHKKPQY